MDPGFYGIGLPHPGVKCFLAQMSKLLIHYGNKSGIWIYMQMSMKLLLGTKLGFSLQHLAMLYPQYHKPFTHYRLKTVWEKAHLFNVRIKIAPLPLKFPRERN